MPYACGSTSSGCRHPGWRHPDPRDVAKLWLFSSGKTAWDRNTAVNRQVCALLKIVSRPRSPETAATWTPTVRDERAPPAPWKARQHERCRRRLDRARRHQIDQICTPHLTSGPGRPGGSDVLPAESARTGERGVVTDRASRTPRSRGGNRIGRETQVKHESDEVIDSSEPGGGPKQPGAALNPACGMGREPPGRSRCAARSISR